MNTSQPVQPTRPTATPTHKLLEDLASGKAAAWTALLDQHGAQILNVSRRILHDEALAEDAVQESLLLIRDHARQFRADRAVDADAAAGRWIVRISCTTALQMLRRSRQSAKRDAAYADLRASQAPAEPPVLAESGEEAALVRRELANLPDDYRLPITLHFLAGLTFADVAAELGCPIGTAKIKVHRGLERLRKRLALLGLLLPLSDLTGCLQRPGLAPIVPTALQLARWQSLLTSTAKPAFAIAAAQGGLSIMAKALIGLSAAALLTTAAVTLTSARTAAPKAAALPPSVARVASATPVTGNAPPAPAPAAAAAIRDSFAADPNDPQWVADFKKALQKKMTLEFVDTKFEEGIGFIQTFSQKTIILLPNVAEHPTLLTLQATNEPLSDVLQRMAKSSELSYIFSHGALVFGDADDIKAVREFKFVTDPETEAQLTNLVSFEAVDQSLASLAKFLSSQSKVKFKLDDAIANKKVSLRFAVTALHNTLFWIALWTGSEIYGKAGVVEFKPAAHAVKSADPRKVAEAHEKLMDSLKAKDPNTKKLKEEF